jgi:hypothetical protein
MGNDQQSRLNEMTDAAFFMRVSFWLFFLLFYILMPAFLHAFYEWRTRLLLLAFILFIVYCVVRNYLLFLYFGDRKKTFRRQLFDNGSTFLGLVVLCISEGFVYAHTSTISIPSYHALLLFLACCFLGPTMRTNSMADKTIHSLKKTVKYGAHQSDIKIPNEILRTIYRFYPRKLPYDSDGYQQSEERRRLLQLREQHAKAETGERFLSRLKEAFPEYAVVDWTNLSDSQCYEYKILLHAGQPILDDDLELIRALGGKRRDLCLFISILGSYWFFVVDETTYDEETDEWKFQLGSEEDQDIEQAVHRLKQVMKSEGYLEVPREIARLAVPDVETEMQELGEATVFHCLFTDLESIH